MASPRRIRRERAGPWADLATALSSRRFRLGLTQRDAADLAGISDRTLRDIETGDVSPGLEALDALADALGLQLALVPRDQSADLPPGTIRINRRTGS